MKTKKIILFIMLLVTLVLMSVSIVILPSTRWIIFYFLISSLFIFLILLLYFLNVRKIQYFKIIEANIILLINRMKNLIRNLNKEEVDIVISDIDLLLLEINFIQNNLLNLNFVNRLSNNSLNNLIDDIWELKDYLFEIKNDMLKIRSDEQHNISKFLNSDENIFVSNIIFIEDYIDIILINLYPYLTSKRKEEYLEFAKKMQTENV